MANTVWESTQLLTPPKTGGVAVSRVCRKLIQEPYFRIRHHGGPVNFKRYSIATIRNPLAVYVSAWAFGCEGHGRMRQRHVTPDRLYRDAMDEGLFHEWMSYVLKKYDNMCVTNVMTATSHHPEKVDAWVIQENMHPSLTRALRNSPAKLPKDWVRRVRILSRKQYNTTKHRHWKEYYTPELMQTVIDREHQIFEYFYPHYLKGEKNGNAQTRQAGQETWG